MESPNAEKIERVITQFTKDLKHFVRIEIGTWLGMFIYASLTYRYTANHEKDHVERESFTFRAIFNITECFSNTS